MDLGKDDPGSTFCAPDPKLYFGAGLPDPDGPRPVNVPYGIFVPRDGMPDNRSPFEKLKPPRGRYVPMRGPNDNPSIKDQLKPPVGRKLASYTPIKPCRPKGGPIGDPRPPPVRAKRKVNPPKKPEGCFPKPPPDPKGGKRKR